MRVNDDSRTGAPVHSKHKHDRQHGHTLNHPHRSSPLAHYEALNIQQPLPPCGHGLRRWVPGGFVAGRNLSSSSFYNRRHSSSQLCRNEGSWDGRAWNLRSGSTGRSTQRFMSWASSCGRSIDSAPPRGRPFAVAIQSRINRLEGGGEHSTFVRRPPCGRALPQIVGSAEPSESGRTRQVVGSPAGSGIPTGGLRFAWLWPRCCRQSP